MKEKKGLKQMYNGKRYNPEPQCQTFAISYLGALIEFNVKS